MLSRKLPLISCLLLLLAAPGVMAQSQPAPESESAEADTPQTQQARPDMTPPLRELAARHGILFGAAMNGGAIRKPEDHQLYRGIFAEQFSVLTPENDSKLDRLMPEKRGEYDWSRFDAMLDFADEHDIKVRGSTAVWHIANPQWLLDMRGIPREEIRQIMVDHITAYGKRYNDRIVYWDVVNEALGISPPDYKFRRSIWGRAGTSDMHYIDLAFRTAHEAAPDVLLVYNDYGADGPGQKADAMYELVKGMLDRGVPIHAVGFQMHLLKGEDFDPEKLIAHWQRFGDLGLEVLLTEIDIDLTYMKQRGREAQLEEQGRRYGLIVDAAVRSGVVTSIQTWGVSDAYSWIYEKKGNPSPQGDPLLLDRDYKPKPAYREVAKALSQPPVPRTVGRGASTQPAGED